MQCSAHTDGALRLSDFDYPLPAELIAQVPAPERDGARLMILDRRRGGTTHACVRDLPRFLRPGDVVVFNDSRVRPARLRGRGAQGGEIELLLIRERAPGSWESLGRPARRLQVGSTLSLAGDVTAVVEERCGDGRYAVTLPAELDVPAWLARHGEVPLPPYIKRPHGALPLDRERYQTVFAAVPGAVAAPTAGLHFTPALLEALRRKGVILKCLTLHVGPGTFLPVRDDDVSAHRMEPEWASIPATTADAIAAARREGRRVVAVGTTTVRALESSASAHGGRVRAGEGWADKFIVPGTPFLVTDALVTNFHLPRSTLLMLVSAFSGRDTVLAAYAAAAREGYRFYSYGDAMLIV
jgi:S-adenosylmethionine:tRNA ribosyltransferase-isomerase